MFLSVLFAFCVSEVAGQTSDSTDFVMIEGNQYILHHVDKGQTIFSLCKEYDIEQKELVGANPQLIFGLKEGDTLKIPYVKKVETASGNEERSTLEQASSVDFNYHVVAKGETVYSLSRKYNISIAAIYRFNPEAKGELLENEILRIPVDDEEIATDGLIREDGQFYYHQVQAGETLYALTKRYNKTLSEIIELNPFVEKELEIGAVLRIPKEYRTEEEDKVVAEAGDEYFIHRVESGDTFYSYKRRFGVTKEQLLELNPQLKDGLLAGLTIKIPTTETQKITVRPDDSGKFIKHEVLAGETFYSLSHLYNVEILTIKALNPELKSRGLKAGETIYIPKKVADTEKTEVGGTELTDSIDWVIPEFADVQFEVQSDSFSVDTRHFTILEDDTFRISMFLPLFYEKNIEYNLQQRSEKELAELDSLKNIDHEVLESYFEIIYDENEYRTDTVLIDSMVVKEHRNLLSHTKYFMNFYQGFLLGLDSMRKVGLKVRLDLYDSEYDNKVIDSILLNSDFINADLIVGPVDVSLQKHVSEFSAKNQIPMVSPFSSNHLFLEDNPFYFQVSPSKEYVLRKTSDFIGDVFYDKNFIVMTLGEVEQLAETSLVDLVRDKFFSSGVYNNVGEVLFTQVDFLKGGHLGYWQVKKTLRSDMENVIFIPASENRDVREALLSRATNSLYVLSEDYDITLVGVSDYPNFKSINTEYFHKLKLHYLTPRFVDYSSPMVNRFISDYRENYYDEPDEYSFRGFDVAVYFSEAYAYMGENFTDKISRYQTSLLQSDFNFQRVSELSGFMNHTVYIMNYTRGYDIKMLTRMSEGHLYVK